MRKAIDSKAKFKTRELRLKKATDPKKREKKATRKQEALDERRRKRAERDADSSDEIVPKNFEDAYSSEDSDDDDEKGVPKHVVSLDDKLKKMAAKGNDNTKELKLQNVIAFNQRKKTAMLKEMITSAKSLEDTKLQKRTFKERYEKPVETFNAMNKKRVEKRREANLKKINKIRIKTKKI